MAGEHASSSTAQGPAKLQYTRNRARRRPATAPSSTSPSLMLPPSLHLQPKAESKTIHYDPSPISTTLSRVFSRLLNRDTNAKKSKDIIPAVPNQSDDRAVSTSRKRLLRHPSRRLRPVPTPSRTSSSQHATPSTTIFLMPQPSSSMEDMIPKSPTINSPFSPVISVGDDTEEGSDRPSADHRKRVQLQMARLAKLKRHLGEEVPPEMVLSPTLHVDATEPRSPSLTKRLSNSKNGHQRPRSLDPTARVQSATAPPSLRLRKGRSLHDRENGFELQAHSSRTVEVVNQKVPFELHLPRPEVCCWPHSVRKGSLMSISAG
jgi:hypothetical protein